VSTLHITNGDGAARGLREFLDDPVVIAADVLHDGPAPAVDDDAWYDLRARFLAGPTDAADAIRDELASSDRHLDAAAGHQEVVLWFEHDLFDQLLLIRTLDRLARRAPRTPICLICIDRFPGVERFVGLGQLSATQLSTLVEAKQRVTRQQFELAARAWAAFRDADPGGLVELACGPELVLPFLKPALRRFLEEYPSTFNGLSRTAHALLSALHDERMESGALFQRVQELEERPFMGDWGFFGVVRTLSATRVPLLSLSSAEPGRDLRGRQVSITGAGERVVRGEADAIALNGIDEWRGGVHLAGTNRSPWRWDPAGETLVSWR
jgi:hypothetical protein